MKKRFKLQNDGKTCSQVLVYDGDDLKYWKDQAKKNNLIMEFDYHVPENSLGHQDASHDVYQIFPSEVSHLFLHLTQRNTR